jgi:Tfp pilus assembly protein FimT
MVMIGVAVPGILAGVDRSRAVAAAHFVSQQCGAARVQAINRSTKVGLQFREQGRDYTIQAFVDSNRNGIRTAEINSGIDVPLGPPTSLSANFPGVRIGVAGSAGNDPIRVGASNLLVFSAAGTATPGSVFVLGKDGTQFALRVLGTTARTRLERYDTRTNKWVATW